jgi:hypothetical protein
MSTIDLYVALHYELLTLTFATQKSTIRQIRRDEEPGTGSGAHPASYPLGTGGCFPGDKSVMA